MKAKQPFVFKGCYFLLESVAEPVSDLAHLLEHLRQVPENSIYLHTYGSYLRHQFSPPPYPNDLASWAAVQLQDPVLAEKLGIVDPLRYQDLEELRQALIDITERHMRAIDEVPALGVGEPFHFLSAFRKIFDLSIEATSLREFIQQLETVHISSIYYHVFDAMLRNRVAGGTFALWLRKSVNLPQLAYQIQQLPFHLFTLSTLRQKLISLCKDYL